MIKNIAFTGEEDYFVSWAVLFVRIPGDNRLSTWRLDEAHDKPVILDGWWRSGGDIGWNSQVLGKGKKKKNGFNYEGMWKE